MSVSDIKVDVLGCFVEVEVIDLPFMPAESRHGTYKGPPRIRCPKCGHIGHDECPHYVFTDGTFPNVRCGFGFCAHEFNMVELNGRDLINNLVNDDGSSWMPPSYSEKWW